jgi:hypothetical protein
MAAHVSGYVRQQALSGGLFGGQASDRDTGRPASSEAVVVAKDGNSKLLALYQAKAFELYTPEEITLTAGDIVRITKHFRAT